MKKTVSLACLLLLAATALFANGKSDAAAGGVATPGEITAIFDTTFLRPEWGMDIFLAKYKELTGIDLIVTQPAHNEYYEKIQLAFASGDIPDVIELDTPHLSTYVAEGAIQDITKQIKGSEKIQAIPEQYLESVRFADGKIYSVGYNTGGGCISYVRKDWLDKLNLDIPATWDEYYAMLQAFATSDPDGNGKDDTIAYVAPGVKDDMYMRDIFQDGIADFTMKNGKWVDGLAQPEFVGAMERLALCYQEGLIDPEAFTNKTSTCREKTYSGNVGVFTYWSGTWNVTLEDGVKNGPAGSSAEFVPIPAIKGSHYNNRLAGQHAITVAAKNPDFVFENVIEYMHDGAEGQMLFTYGVEGVHWDPATHKFLPELDDPKKTFPKAYIHPELQPAPWSIDNPFELEYRIENSVAMHRASAVQQQLIPISKTHIKVSGDLKALREEVISKIAIGDMKPVEGLEFYKAEAEKLGMSTILAELNSK
ncbi:MAG: extracellular solute-binding protein [Spirochaetales bacterium]|nr:extracellular solute-binding protein [Spirochaetales bacterium]